MGADRITPRAFVEAMTLPVWQAAAAVRWLEGRVRNRPKPGETTEAKAALTAGDCVSQEILLTALWHHFPWVSLDAEEDTPTAKLFTEESSPQRVVIDPIDGTLRYLNRDGLYAILLGLEGDDGVEAVLIGLPQEGLVVRAIRGHGVEMARHGGAFHDARLAPAPDESPGACPGLAPCPPRILVSHELPPGLADRLGAEGFQVCRAAGGAIGVAPLLPGTVAAIRTTSRGEGLSHRTWISTLATLEAGGCAETLDGELPRVFTQGVGGVLVARDRETIERLRELVRACAAEPRPV